jgi:hypothetical protein
MVLADPVPARDSHVDDNEFIEISNVVAISDGLALVCEINGMNARVGIPYAAIHPSSPVRSAGQSGTLILKRFVARDLGIS